LVSSIVKVCEFHEGLRGGGYHYVIEGNRLVHISRYAVRREGVRELLCYYVDLGRLRGRLIVEFSSTRSGPFDRLWVYPAEDLPLEWDRRRRRELPVTAINGYKLDHLGLDEMRFLDEWDKYYRPMLRYIRGEVSMISATELLKLHLGNDLKYPASFLIPYSKRSRLMSLSVLTREIHQVWVAVRILRVFTTNTLNLFFEQSPISPLAEVNGYGMWYEFDLNPHTMFGGVLWWRDEIPSRLRGFYERVKRVKRELGLERYPLRPDIVFTYARSANEFLENQAVKLVIECKNIQWSESVEKQVLAYKMILQPDHIAVALLRQVPQGVKHKLNLMGVDVIDNVYPGGAGERELVDYVRSVLR
jgi:hypothetical protein